MEEAMPFGVVADLPATYVAFDTLNGLGAKGARVIRGHDVRTAETSPSHRLLGTCTDLLGARTSR
jgi:hypothetical protein